MTQSLNSEPSQAVSALIEAGCHYRLSELFFQP